MDRPLLGQLSSTGVWQGRLAVRRGEAPPAELDRLAQLLGGFSGSVGRHRTCRCCGLQHSRSNLAT